ncbi:unnamed protein product [Blepharisma stoltei]|uniref:Uncharacterized protein n=1 Tax=Blepharisma stoltei TaxID=1481888 RepID=A0AAU9JIL0_9CILI|nr:unnamed protein product [Blepharisma stoltei]
MINYHNMINEGFLKSLEACLPYLVNLIIKLATIRNECCIDALIKILTLSCFAATINNSILGQEMFAAIIPFFQLNFSRFNTKNSPALYMDLLLRRFLQFLNFTLVENMDFEFDLEFWIKVLDIISKEKTWNLLFLALSRYLNLTAKKGVERKSKEEIKNIKKRRSEMFLRLILQKQVSNNFQPGDDKYVFFCKNKYWTSFSVNFYREKAIEMAGNVKASSSYFGEVINILDWYMIIKKRRNIGFIISESQLYKFFDWPKIWKEKIRQFDALATYQIHANSYDLNFLREYFSNIWQMDDWYRNISDAEKIILELLLLNYNNKTFNEDFEALAVKFSFRFFEHVYENASKYIIREGTKIIEIFSLIFKFLPQSWEFIKANAKMDDGDIIILKFKNIKDRYSKCLLLIYLQDLNKNYSVTAALAYFLRFIDHLINYLQSRKGYDSFCIDILFSNNVNGFSLSNIDYNDPQHCAKILMSIFWETDFRGKKWIMELKKKKKRIEEIKNQSKEIKPENNFENTNPLYESPSDWSQLSNEKKLKIDNLENLSIWDNLISKTNTKLIIDLLNDFKESYILKMLFDKDWFQPQVKKWLLSQLKNLFNLSLKRSEKSVNFIAETNSFVIRLISNN